MKNMSLAILAYMMAWLAGVAVAWHIIAHFYVEPMAASLEAVASRPFETEEETGSPALCARCHYLQPVVCKVTAYSNDPISINVPRWRDGRTATMKRARRGLVAADWSIFPPGTVLYIHGYGVAEVQDRGSAVRGHHIDLFMETRQQALDWGVREMDVFIMSSAVGARTFGAAPASPMEVRP